MARIKDERTIPQHLQDGMGFGVGYEEIPWDFWLGDDADCGKCSTIACRYSVEDVYYYFCFDRDSQGDFKFRALVASQESGTDSSLPHKWFAKKYTEQDFEGVRKSICHCQEYAVSDLGLVQEDIHNPFSFIYRLRLSNEL